MTTSQPTNVETWSVDPLRSLLLERELYADVLFLTYADSFWHPNGHVGEREAIAAQVDVDYGSPPEIADDVFPSPCLPPEIVEDTAIMYMGQPYPHSEPGSVPAFMTAQAVGLTPSVEDAAAVVEAAETCETTGALWPEDDDPEFAAEVTAAGADAATASRDDPLQVRAVTFHVGPVVGFIGVRGTQVPDVDVVRAFANELVSKLTLGVREEGTEPAAVDPLARTVIHLITDGRIIAVGGGEPDRVLVESTAERALGFHPPAIAPDWETVAFIWYDPADDSSISDRQEHLSIRQSDGNIVDVVSTDQLTTPRGDTRWEGIDHPTWNVDGSLLAFEWDEPSSWGEVWTVSADGTGLTLASPPSSGEWFDGDEGPFWGPDPEDLFIDSSRTRQGSLWRGRPDGTELTQVTPEIEDSQISNGTVSPDGRWLVAVNLRNEFLIVDLDTGDFTLLPPGPEVYHSGYGRPQWSPDGRFVVYVADRAPNAFLVEPAAAEATRLGLPPGGRTLVWTADGSGLITTYFEEVEDAEQTGLAHIEVATGEFTIFREDLERVSILQPTHPRASVP